MKESAVKKIAVLTSGGDSPGMNAALRAVVRTASHFQLECYGVREGYNGLINDDFTKMGPRSVKNIITQGGTILKSARSMEFKTQEGRKKAYDNCKKYGIDALVCIGGDGSFTGSKVFNEEFDNAYVFNYRMARIVNQEPRQFLDIEDKDTQETVIQKFEDKINAILESKYYKKNENKLSIRY